MARSQIDIVLGDLESVTEQVVVALSVNISAELIERTPVDTGWARANWVPRAGKPFRGGSQQISKEEREAKSRGRAGVQENSIASLTATYKLQQGPVFNSNNVPYIQVLNNGSSDQAPSGFIQQGIKAGVKSVEGRRFTP